MIPIPQANEDFEDDDEGPRLTPTAIDLVNPFDSSMLLHELSVEQSVGLAIPRRTQPPIDPPIDPPTTLVRRDNFRELLPGTIVGENYEVDARLSAGAMGEVYAARHVGLGKQVAIKVIHQCLSRDDSMIGRFTMEARTLAQIQHPSIVAVEHVGTLPDGRAYFVMEYLRGESLSERLARGHVALREALRILDQMARGLEAAHGSGVIHRDLKPDNTFLVHLPGEEPVVKLLDFGLAKLAAESIEIDQRAERSESGVAIGTPMYMSPEQARGPDVDHRTDIYALGCVAYELVLGVRPFSHAQSAPEVYAAHLHASPPLPRSIWPEIPPQLDLALFAMLSKDPAHRPTLAQVRSVVTDLRASTSSQPAAAMFVEPRAMKERMRRATIAAAAIGVLVIGAAIGATFGAALIAKNSAAVHPQPVASPSDSTNARMQTRGRAFPPPPDVSAGRASSPSAQTAAPRVRASSDPPLQAPLAVPLPPHGPRRIIEP